MLWPGTEPIRQGESRNIDLIIQSLSSSTIPFGIRGKDAYPSIAEKAIALFHSLIANHCFLNGNKCTALIAFDAFLSANDHFLILGQSEMYGLAEKNGFL